MPEISPYGASTDALGYYWIRKASGIGAVAYSALHLVTIDDHGTVRDTGNRRDDDPAARDQGGAVRHHLADGIKRADADLEQCRQELAENPPAPPPRVDPATARFLADDE